MYICILHIYIYIYTHVYMYVCIYVYMHTCIYVSMYTYGDAATSSPTISSTNTTFECHPAGKPLC